MYKETRSKKTTPIIEKKTFIFEHFKINSLNKLPNDTKKAAKGMTFNAIGNLNLM
jgi:hypothetical protein